MVTLKSYVTARQSLRDMQKSRKVDDRPDLTPTRFDLILTALYRSSSEANIMINLGIIQPHLLVHNRGRRLVGIWRRQD